MKQPWRIGSRSFFLVVLLLAGLLANAQTAPGSATNRTVDDLQLYTELVNLAHERYGAAVSYEDLVDSSVGGMLRTLDPHSSLQTPEAYSGMREKQQTSFYGVGILVGMRNGQLTVISPIEGGPASRLGIQAGDVIGSIDGETTEPMSLDDAIRMLKGPKGTQVRITILRRGLDEPLAMTVTRAEIPQVTVRQTYMMTPDTGYIQLSEFARGTGREMAEAITKLKALGMKRLLLDLRNNGGGLLDQAADVADQFLPAGSSIVETRGRTRDSFQSFRTSGKYPDLGVPVIVLVNEGTASASEIVAGAIQDHDHGLVVGEPTWGKGLVQTVYNLSYGYGLALTTAKYYTPSGRLIQRDYSSFFDYYAHAGAGSPELTGKTADPSQIFQTDLGRKVYGGGAITPDVIAKDSELLPFASFLLARNAYLTFALDYTRRRKQMIQSREWQPEPELATEFRDWVVAEKIATAEEMNEALANQEVRDFSLLQLRAEIMNSVFDLEARHRALAKGDVQLQAALKLFDRAAAMLAQRQALGAPNPRQSGASEGAPVAVLRKPAAPAAQSAVSYQVQLGLAKLLASEGWVKQALAAFEEAERLAPKAPYVRLEHALLLAQIGSDSRLSEERRANELRRAAATIDEALRLAPANLDVLRGAGEVYFDFSSIEPAAREKAIAVLEAVRGQDPYDLRASLSLGQLYLEEQPELAVQVLRDFIARVPRHPMAYTLLAEALLRSEQESEAEAVLGEMLAFDAASLEARLVLADLRAKRDDHEAALATLRAAPEPSRNDPRLRHKLAWELYATGDLKNALATIRGLLSKVASDDSAAATMRLLEGLILSAEGRTGEALELLRALHKADPGDVALAIQVAQLLQRDGKSREGAQILSQLGTELARQGKTADEGEVRLELAQLQLQAKDWDGVEKSVAPLLAAADEATRLRAVFLRGDALLEARRYDEALAALENAGASPAVEAKRAAVLHRAGRESEARSALDALASRGDAASLLTAAQTLQRLERYGDSIPILEKAIAAAPQSAIAWFLLGVAHERNGQRPEAIAAFRRSLEFQPDFHAAMNYLSYTYAEAGEHLDEALRMASRAVALEPENGAYVDTLGWTYYRLNRHEEARSTLERAIHLDPSDASLHEHLGDVYVALRRVDQARQAYRQALELGADKADELRRKLAEVDRPRR